MKEYADLLADDPAYADRARAFAEQVRDVSEILDELGPVAPRHPLEMTVAYHDACHLAHAQGVRAQPRRLLEAIPGLELREIAEAELCCGSAGIYNILNPEPARELGDRKAANIVATGAAGARHRQPGLPDAGDLRDRAVRPPDGDGAHRRGARRLHPGCSRRARSSPPESVHPTALPGDSPCSSRTSQPVGDSLALSALCGAIPLARPVRAARRAEAQGLDGRADLAGVALVVAVVLFEMPVGQALLAGTEGAAFGFFPILWIVINAIWVYNLTVASGHFDVLRRSFEKVSPDQRVQAIIIAFCFGALLEALAGFGTPVAITVVMLMALGFQPIKAAVVALVANTAPVAFGALATPIVTLATVTSGASDDPGLTTDTLGSMVGRQTPILAVVVPLILVFIVDGRRGLEQTWLPAHRLRARVRGRAVRRVQLHLGAAHRHHRLAGRGRRRRAAAPGLAAGRGAHRRADRRPRAPVAVERRRPVRRRVVGDHGRRPATDGRRPRRQPRRRGPGLRAVRS